MYFNVNFYVFFKVIKVHLLVTELYIYQNARCNDKKIAVTVLCCYYAYDFNNIIFKIYLCSDDTNLLHKNPTNAVKYINTAVFTLLRS